MGKGDKRSRKGKVWKGSYGNTRRKKKGNKPAFVPKPKPKKIVAPLESTPEEALVIEGAEVKAAKPKKVAAKKPKVEGEKKETVKKEPKKKAASTDTEGE